MGAPGEPAQPGAKPKPTQAGTNPTPGDDTARLHHITTIPGFEFARAAGMTEDEAIALAAEAADQAIEDHMIAPVALMLARYEAQGKTLAEFHADLQGIVGSMDDDALREVLDRAFKYAVLRGAATSAA